MQWENTIKWWWSKKGSIFEGKGEGEGEEEKEREREREYFDG